VRRALGLVAFLALAGCQEQAAEKPAAPQSSASASVDPLNAESAGQERAGTVACAVDETPIFTCAFKDGKRVAVCGAGKGAGRYRYGGAAPELELNGGRYAYTMYSGGGESQIAFANGETRYIVFSRMVRTGFDENGNRPAISDGIVIERGGKFLDIKLCEDPDLLPVQMDAAGAVWEEEPELFTEETMRADPPGDE
jgi:hypothetical protein